MWNVIIVIVLINFELPIAVVNRTRHLQVKVAKEPARMGAEVKFNDRDAG